jgi:hypothetical protein
MHRARFLIPFIIIVPLLALSVGALRYLTNVARQGAARLPEVISTAASENLGLKVKIGGVKVLDSGIALSNVLVSSSGNPKHPLLQAPKAFIACNPLTLLKGDDPAKSIKRITITKPEIYLERDPRGTWNLESLLRRTDAGSKSGFRAAICVESARVHVTDRTADAVHCSNTFSGVHAQVNLSKMPSIRYAVRGVGERGRLGWFTAGGGYNSLTGALTAAVKVRDVDAPYWASYLPGKPCLVLSGKAGVDAVLSRRKEGRIIYKAMVRIKGGSARLTNSAARLDNINGSFVADNNSVSVTGDARLGQTPFNIKGRVKGFSSPKLALSISSSHANLKELARIAGLKESLNSIELPEQSVVQSWVTGSLGSPAIEIKAGLPGFTVDGYRCSNVNLRGVYKNSVLKIGRVTGRVIGGNVDAAGRININEKVSVELSGRAEGIRFEHIPAVAESNINAGGTGRFALQYSPDMFKIDFQGCVPFGRFRDRSFHDSAVDISYKDGILEMREISARTYGGIVAAAGRVTGEGDLFLQVSGADINLAEIPAAPGRGAVGKLQFTGEMHGSIQSPEYVGQVEVYNAGCFGLSAGRIAGRVQADYKKIVLDNVVVNAYSGKTVFTGGIDAPLSKDPRMDLSIKVDLLDVNALSRALRRPVDTGGRFSAVMTAKGGVKDANLSAAFEVEGAAFKEISVDGLEGRAVYEGGSVRLDELKMCAAGASLTAAGRVNKDGGLMIRFRGRQVSLAKLSKFARPYAFLSGDASLTGRVTGTLTDPKASLTAQSDNILLNGVTFRKSSLKCVWSRSDVQVQEAGLYDGGAAYKIYNCSYNPESRVLKFNMQVEKGDGGRLFDLLDYSPYLRASSAANSRVRRMFDRVRRPVRGTVNVSSRGSVDFSGGTPVPDFELEAEVDDLTVGHKSVKRLQVKGGWQNGVVNLARLTAIDGDANLQAEGRLGPRKALDIKLDAHNLLLSATKGWVSVPGDISGRADITLVAKGTLSSPSADMFVEVVDPVIHGARFDRLRGRFSTQPSGKADKGSFSCINVDDLRLVLGDHSFKAAGYLPVDWEEMAIPLDGSILLQSRLDSDSLKILSALSSIDTDAQSENTFKGSVKLSGTVRKPLLEGSVAWHDGRIKIPRIVEPLEGVELAVNLAGDALTVEKLSGRAREGGTFTVKGLVRMAEMKPVLDLQVKTDNLVMAGRNLSGSYDEDAKAHINANLKITGQIKTPMVSGDVNIPSGYISLGRPGKLEPVRAAVNPGFNVNVLLGKEMMLASGQVRAPLYGKLSIAGTLAAPVVDGDIDISDGAIFFPMSQLRLMPGSSMDVHLSSVQRSAVLLDFTAQGNIVDVNSFGQRKRYAITMESKGPINNLASTFTSSPLGLSSERIVSLLTGQGQLEWLFSRSHEKDVSQEIGGIVSAAMAPGVFYPIEQAFQTMFGIDQIGLNVPYTGTVQMTLGNPIWDNGYLSYSQYLGPRPEYEESLYELKLTQKLNESLQLYITTEQDYRSTVGMEGRIRF